MNTASLSFDFAVIGGGSAGYAAARSAAALGLKTVVIDGAPTLGGLCILRGCMPSKTLIESANRSLAVRRAAEFGLRIPDGPSPDLRVIRDRKRELISGFASYRQGQLQDGRFELLRGSARFASSTSLEVTDAEGLMTVVKFSTACVATGSEVNVIPAAGLREAGFWTSDDILDAADLPHSFIVLGGGAIALEMAHYLEAMGRQVTLIQRSGHLLTNMDPECGDTVAQAFRKRGIQVHCGTSIQHVERIDGICRVHFTQNGAAHTVEAEEILLAAGRIPASTGLGLAEAGIAMDGHKIRVSSRMQTSTPNIFAAGDVCSPLDVVHIAIQQGEAAAHNAAVMLRGGEPEREVDYRLTLFGVFSSPQAAMVGATEKELRQAGVPFVAASYPFDDHGKSMVMGETEGFVKLLAHRESGELLGGSVVGPEATELIHEITVAMAFKATAAQLAAVPHYHPTLSEIWTYPAEDLADLTRS